ncbi:uncharacterized protein LOC127749885 [Frankliniella occidentalis]|uniref:Uncharacterized protein LOC127749885 n=1 Tax=Frankliniella occidentalis TaxID=133901 RepID=A0A9C6WXQ2_FRAOC|nr:uncharacterized protein LOC127749885 [Frankliniella occidentalis]
MKRPFDVHVFDGLQPTAYLVALYGILPVTIRSWVPGFNPRHSTLCYCVCVQAVVLWRIRQAYVTRLPSVQELAEDAVRLRDWTVKFVAAHSMVHLTGKFDMMR